MKEHACVLALLHYNIYWMFISLISTFFFAKLYIFIDLIYSPHLFVYYEIVEIKWIKITFT